MNHGLCDIDAVLYQLSYQAKWELIIVTHGGWKWMYCTIYVKVIHIKINYFNWEGKHKIKLDHHDYDNHVNLIQYKVLASVVVIIMLFCKGDTMVDSLVFS